MPFVNRSENPALGWTETGLQRLLHHALETASQVVGVTSIPADSGAGASAQAGLPESRIGRAAADRHADGLVTADVDEVPSGFLVSLAWKLPRQPLRTLVLVGLELPMLILRAASHLAVPAPWQVEVERTHPLGWARLHETIAHWQRFSRADLAARLEDCFAALPRLPPLQLLQAELLMRAGELERSEAAALSVWDRDDSAAGRDLDRQLGGLVLLNEAAMRRGDLRQFRQRIVEALAFVNRHEDRLRDDRHLGRLWSQAAYAEREAGRFEAAASYLEGAILIAVRSGLRDPELRYRGTLAQLLSWQGQANREEDVLQRLVTQSQESGHHETASISMRKLASVCHGLGRHGESVRWARKSLAVALASAVEPQVTADARAVLIEALIATDRLDEAERLLNWRRRHKPASASAVHDIGVISKAAWLHWRRGQLDEAAACYRDILDDDRLKAWVKWANFLHSEYAVLLALMGRADEAGDVLDRLPQTTLPTVVGRARAAIAMARGRRAEARAGLLDLLRVARPGQPHVHLLAMDLAWLLIEDGDHGEALHWLGRCVATGSDVTSIGWIQLALGDRVDRRVDVGRWAGLRAACPSLVRHCPWLGTADDAQARCIGQARSLPNLLTALSW